MRMVVQRVNCAAVHIDLKLYSSINAGVLVFLGVEVDDDVEDATWLARKLIGMRIFNDDTGHMNKPIEPEHHEIMVVSQFTLHASTKKGNRPSFIRSAKPELATSLYEYFVGVVTKDSGCSVKTGAFGADMKVELINDGPVTILVDSKRRE